MQLLAIQRILGLLLAVFSFTMLPPAGIALLYHDGQADGGGINALPQPVGNGAGRP